MYSKQSSAQLQFLHCLVKKQNTHLSALSGNAKRAFTFLNALTASWPAAAAGGDALNAASASRYTCQFNARTDQHMLRQVRLPTQEGDTQPTPLGAPVRLLHAEVSIICCVTLPTQAKVARAPTWHQAVAHGTPPPTFGILKMKTMMIITLQ